jgi:UDP-N-acetylmuramate--alanine ligase
MELSIDDDAVVRALGEFSGIDRRFQVLGTITTAAGRITFIDDYGHHPTEIAATVAAVRDAWPNRRLVVAFQPHRYTRTYELMDDFAQVLSRVDVLLLTEVYAADEEPIAGADGKALARAVRTRGDVEPVFVEDVNLLPAALTSVMRDDDIVLTLGAGSIGAVAQSRPDVLAIKGPVGIKK